MASDRFYAFFGKNKTALAMDVGTRNLRNYGIASEQKLVGESDQNVFSLTFAFAFCNERDNFNKRIAKTILNGRLDAQAANLEERQVRLTYETVYIGDHPKRDVMCQLMDRLRTLPKNRPHFYIKNFKEILDDILDDLFPLNEVFQLDDAVPTSGLSV